MKGAIFSIFGAALVFVVHHAAGEDLSKIPEVKSVDEFKWRPNITYPYEAKRAGLTGSGVAVIEIDSSTGKVKAVRMGKSTGSTILDQAAIEAFGQARFKKGCPKRVKIPVTFTLTQVPR